MNYELIKHVRQIANLTQRQLAEKIGVHDSLISKIEAGVVPLQPAIHQKILQVFNEAGITPQDIALLHLVFQNRKMKPVKKDWKCL